ncbi:unnamed protein product, partial [Dracunculus medinensis]|uniref:SH2 domain-containing protein n=1 Tax=Dracunculus medinensis TaxID=318479 RepID=A0A0N4UEX1_DRAME
HVTVYHSGRSDDIAPTIKTQPQPTGDVESEFFAVKTRALDKPLNYAIDSASPSCLRSFEKFSSQYQNSINDFSVCSCTKQLRDDVQSKGIDLNVSVTANEPFSSEAIPFSRSVPNTSPSFFCHNFLDSNVTAAASENVGFLSGDALLIDCSRVALSEPNVCSKSGIPISSVRHNVQRNVSPTSNLHWTTVSQSTSVFYSKRISIEKTHRSFREDVLRNGSSTRIGAKYYRKHFSDQSKPGYNSYGRSFAVMNTYDFELSKNDTYRPSFENVSVSRLSQWTTFDSMAERDLKSEESIHIGSGKYQEMNRARSLYAQENGRMLDRHAVDCSIPHEISTHGKSLRYNLLKPDAPLGYEFSSATMWESQCSPRRFRIPERRFRPSNTDSYVKEDKMDINSSDNSSYESLYYQPSNLEEIPIVSLVADLPMIEEDAIECVRPTVQPIRTQDLSPGEHMCSRSTKISPLRRARQRIRSYCTML